MLSPVGKTKVAAVCHKWPLSTFRVNVSELRSRVTDLW